MMRIAFLSTVYGYPFGGADILWSHAADIALGRGDAVLVGVTPAVAAHARVQSMIRQGARHFPTGVPTIPRSQRDRIKRRMEYAAGETASLVSALRIFRPDRVIFSCGGTYDLVREGRVLGFLQDQRIPYFVIANWQTEAPFLSPVDLQRAGAAFCGARRIFFVSRRNLEITRRHLALPLRHASLIQVPIRPPPSGGVPWPAGDTPTFAVVARLEHVKGLDLLLPALAQFPGASQSWRLNIHGEGPGHDALQLLASQLGLSRHVRFHGFVPDLAGIWRENQCLVSASRDEGLPTAMIEALLYGRPVIATRVGAAEEWIEEGVTGFICDPGSVESLADAIRRAWCAKSAWSGMGSAARQRASARHVPDDAGRLLAPEFVVY